MSLFAPTFARQRLAPKLILIWLLGACAVALAFGVLLNTWDGRPLSGLLDSLLAPKPDDDRGPQILTIFLSLGGLLGAGRVWWRSWRRRLRGRPGESAADREAALRDFIYPIALWQGLVGYFAFWIAIGLLATVAMTITGSWREAANLPQTLLVVLFMGAMGAPLNALNFLFVIPQVIWCWQRTAYRAYLRNHAAGAAGDGGMPGHAAQVAQRASEAEAPALPGLLPPRGVLAAWVLGLLLLAVLDRYVAYRAG
ncbi:hypothetical protein [Achromobacter aloeverae]